MDVPEAQAQLGRRAPAELEGVAKLHEVREGVEIELDVDKGKPGQSRVILADPGACSRPEQLVQSAKPVQSAATPAVLGTLEIAENGEGSLEATVPKATLRLSEGATLLGKELVVVTPGSAGRTPELLACAAIERMD